MIKKSKKTTNMADMNRKRNFICFRNILLL